MADRYPAIDRWWQFQDRAGWLGMLAVSVLAFVLAIAGMFLGAWASVTTLVVIGSGFGAGAAPGTARWLRSRRLAREAKAAADREWLRNPPPWAR